MVASWLRPGCVPAASRLRPVASRLRPGCVPAASRLRPGCVPVASRLRPGCVLVTSLRGAPPIFHLRLFINKNCVIILKPVISFKSVFPRKITFSSKHPVYQRSKIIGRGLFILRGQQGHICIHTCLNIRRRRET